MTALTPGANAPVESAIIRVDVTYAPLKDAEIDVSAFALSATGKVQDDSAMCFYGQTKILAGAVDMVTAESGQARFMVDLSRLPSDIDKVALAATIHENKASFHQVPSLMVSLTGGIESRIPTDGMQETALILGELYRRQGQWKYRCVAQGFAGGLAPLARHFGVTVADDTAPPPPIVSPAPPLPPPPTISLSKVTLDKSRPSISLEKTAAGFGLIKVNLNWSQRKSMGLFGRAKSIDLDVGCLFEMQDGYKGVVQALGNSFGSLQEEPYVKLMGDDRTGSVAGGEWLHIDGQHWSRIRRLLIFAFIYDGAPNWAQTDGVVTVFVPGQPEIEVRLNEEGGRLGCCAIALLENDNGAVKVTRRVDFHRSQEPMDKAYRWGMRWSAGSK